MSFLLLIIGSLFILRPSPTRSSTHGSGRSAAASADACLQLCNEILNDPTPFSAMALELASRPPIVIAAPQEPEQNISSTPREPLRTIHLELEQKQQGMTLMLHQLQFYQQHFEIHHPLSGSGLLSHQALSLYHALSSL